MEEKKSKKRSWPVVVWISVIFAVLIAAYIGFLYSVDHRYEQIETYFIYSHKPSMKDGETFKGFQMEEMGRFDPLEAENDADACKQAEKFVIRKIEMYQDRIDDEDVDKRALCIWELRTDYTLMAVEHARNIIPETVISLVGESPRNLYCLMQSLESNGFKFRIVKDDFVGENAE